MNAKPRNLFLTSTFWSILILLTQACWQPVSDIVLKGATSDRIQVVALAILTSMYGITQRLDKDESLYTPDFLPGRNKNQVVVSVVDTTKNKLIEEFIPDPSRYKNLIIKKDKPINPD